MRRHLWSTLALLIMVILAFGSVDGGGGSHDPSRIDGTDSTSTDVASEPSVEEGDGKTGISPPADSPSGKSKKPQQVLYVNSDVYLKVMSAESHVEFLSTRLAEVRELIRDVPAWNPLESGLSDFVGQVTLEADVLRNIVDTEFPPEVADMFHGAITAVETNGRAIRTSEPDDTRIHELGTAVYDCIKSESAKKGSDVPRGELLSWTKDRVKKLANFPSTVKFGWLAEVLPASNNQAATVVGTFKASNAFGLETKHEYRATWSADTAGGGRQWSLSVLSIDGADVYHDPDLIEGLAEALEKGRRAGEQWAQRRARIDDAIKTVREAVEANKKWQDEAHVFTSDLGTTLKARLKGVKLRGDERVLTLEKADGSTVDVPAKRLSESDREYVEEEIKRRR